MVTSQGSVVVVGASGGVGRLLLDRLATRFDAVVGVSRNQPRRLPGTVRWKAFDIAAASEADWDGLLAGVDVVIYTAGAGYGSTAEAKRAVDRDGAISAARSAVRKGVRRFILVSSMGADDPTLTNSDTPFGLYLTLKGEADDTVAGLPIDWTIVRPSGLVNGPAEGLVDVGAHFGGGSLSRADLATVLVRLVVDGIGSNTVFELTSGTTPIVDLDVSGFTVARPRSAHNPPKK